ncbi:MAG: ThiF family adenylyltransferase [Solirubrobacterales bacterium]
MKHWTERFPEIYAEEREYWLEKGFQENNPSRREVSFEGPVVVRRQGEDRLETRSFKLRLDYPSGYPFRMPRITFLQPPIRRGRHQGPDGHPCLFPPSDWDTNVRASEIYAATERWLKYHLDDHFPRELAIYELPEYFSRAPYVVLAPPEVMNSFSGKAKGRFSVTRLTGHELSVLRSVDGDGIGDGLKAELASSRQWEDKELGKWYRLNREPPGLRHTGELQRELAESGHQVSFQERPGVGRHLVGLVFEDVVLGEERAILLDIGVAKKTQQHKIGEGWPVRLAELHLISRAELQRRLQGVRDLDALAAKKVTLFGVGAIGSSLALALGREGVGGFELCDPDLLRPGNVVRHALDLTSVGQDKAIALETALGRVNPDVNTAAQLQNLGDPDVIATCTADASLVIAAIGDEPLERLLCEVVLDHADPPPVILVRSLHAGAAFRVALIRPGRDACFECLREYKSKGDPKWIEVPEDELPDVYDAGCATAARPGAGLTSQTAAAFAAARALEVLECRDREANHWLSVEQPIPGSDPRLHQPLALHEATYKPRSGCASCAD